MGWNYKKLYVTDIFVPDKTFLRRKKQGVSGGKGIKPSLIKKQGQSVIVLFKAHLFQKKQLFCCLGKKKVSVTFLFHVHSAYTQR